MKLTGPAAAETIGRVQVMELPWRKELAACAWVRVERMVRPLYFTLFHLRRLNHFTPFSSYSCVVRESCSRVPWLGFLITTPKSKLRSSSEPLSYSIGARLAKALRPDLSSFLQPGQPLCRSQTGSLGLWQTGVPPFTNPLTTNPSSLGLIHPLSVAPASDRRLGDRPPAGPPGDPR